MPLLVGAGTILCVVPTGQLVVALAEQAFTVAPAVPAHTNMIAQLRGTLTEKRPNQVIVDVGGVGYLVNISLSTFYALAELHQEVSLLIHTHVREDSLALYGFLTAREKHLFESLLSVSGVGPTLAIKILSGMSADDLVPAIRQGDLLRLTRIPGVGKKTAERMVVELRDKLAAMEPAEAEPAPSRTGPAGDVISALLNLGYDRRASEAAVENAEREAAGAPAGKTFESLLRAALQQLSSPARKGARAASGEA
jgi:Holliday junction DNA helicase RuvA